MADMTIKSLHNISRMFGISEHRSHQILLKQGNIMGCQLLGFVNGALVIDENYFNKFIETDALFKTFVVAKDIVCAAASEKIPFDLMPRVYFLLDDNVVVYVGMSNGICSRIARHVESKIFNKVATFEIEKTNLLMVEALNILHYTPSYNKSIMRPEEYFREVIKRTGMRL